MRCVWSGRVGGGGLGGSGKFFFDKESDFFEGGNSFFS